MTGRVGSRAASVLALAALAGGCAGRELNETANGQTIQLAPGTSFAVRLQGSQGLTYPFQRTHEVRGGSVRFAGAESFPQEGTAGVDLLRFETLLPGTTDVRLARRYFPSEATAERVRARDRNAPADAHVVDFELHVIVK